MMVFHSMNFWNFPRSGARLDAERFLVMLEGEPEWRSFLMKRFPGLCEKIWRVAV
jgi:hypothetical protein